MSSPGIIILLAEQGGEVNENLPSWMVVFAKCLSYLELFNYDRWRLSLQNIWSYSGK